MTNEEMFEYNKRCALFLGWKETTELFQIDWVGCKTKERLDRLDNACIPILEKNGDVIFSDFSVINFTNNWNWIIEVVEAIENIKYKISNESIYSLTISNKICKIENVDEEIVWRKANSKKEAAVQAINQFLIWYDKNK